MMHASAFDFMAMNDDAAAFTAIARDYFGCQFFKIFMPLTAFLKTLRATAAAKLFCFNGQMATPTAQTSAGVRHQA